MCDKREVSMDVLLAIKPEFAEKILAGTKHYEFRRVAFKEASDVDLIYLYASAPISQIVGVFTTTRISEDSPRNLWNRYGDASGIDDSSRFMEYFDGTDTGFAIHVDETWEFETPIDPETVCEDFTAPMSFSYLDAEVAQKLRSHVPETIQSTPTETDLSQFG